MQLITSRPLEPLLPLGQRYILRHSYIGDSYTVLRDLRQEDHVEWAASVPGGVEDNLWSSISGSAEAYTVADVEDDTAHIIFGVYPKPEPTTWLLGTNRGQVDCAWILYMCREFYTGFFDRWPNTVCYSHPLNEVHHRWLKWMGYSEVARVPWGPYRAEFIEFRRNQTQGG